MEEESAHFRDDVLKGQRTEDSPRVRPWLTGLTKASPSCSVYMAVALAHLWSVAGGSCVHKHTLGTKSPSVSSVITQTGQFSL